MSSSRILLTGAIAVLGLGLFVIPARLVAQPAPASTAAPGDPAEKARIEQIVHAYLLENPGILREMAAKLQENDRTEQVAAQADVFKEQRDLIYNSPKQVELGNPKGDVTLVEFFDYNCGYCRKAFSDTEALLKNDKNLRIVLKEFPVLGEGSRDAARVAVAVHAQAPEKYLDFHKALLTSDEQADGDHALKVAEGLGLDMNRLSADLTGPTIDDPMIEAHQIASRLGIDGTPTYIVADTVVPGAIGLDAVTSIIANVRKCGKTACS